MLESRELTALLVVFPFFAAPLFSLFQAKRIQTFGVMTTGVLLGLGAFLLIPRVPFSFSPEPAGTAETGDPDRSRRLCSCSCCSFTMVLRIATG